MGSKSKYQHAQASSSKSSDGATDLAGLASPVMEAINLLNTNSTSATTKKKRQHLESDELKKPSNKKQQAIPIIPIPDIPSVHFSTKVRPRRTSFGKISIGEKLRRANALAANKRNQELASQYEQLNMKEKTLATTSSDSVPISASFSGSSSSHSTPTNAIVSFPSNPVSSSLTTSVSPPPDDRNSAEFKTLLSTAQTTNDSDIQAASNSPPPESSSSKLPYAQSLNASSHVEQISAPKSRKNVSFNMAANVTIETEAIDYLSRDSRSLSPPSPGQSFIDLTLFDTPTSHSETESMFIDLTLPADASVTLSPQSNAIDLTSDVETTMQLPQPLSPNSIPLDSPVSSPTQSHSVLPTSSDAPPFASSPPSLALPVKVAPKSNQMKPSSKRPKSKKSKSPRIFIESLEPRTFIESLAPQITEQTSSATNDIIESFTPEPSPESLPQSPPELPTQDLSSAYSTELSAQDLSPEYLPGLSPELSPNEAIATDSAYIEQPAITPPTTKPQRGRRRKSNTTRKPNNTTRRRKRNDDAPFQSLPNTNEDPAQQQLRKLRPLRSRGGDPAEPDSSSAPLASLQEPASSNEIVQLQNPPAPDYRLVMSLRSIDITHDSTDILAEYNRRLQANKLEAQTRMDERMNRTPDHLAIANLRQQEEIAALKKQLNLI